MGKLIDLKQNAQRKTDENLIALKPWEFRRACWKTDHFVQAPKSQCDFFESFRGKAEKRKTELRGFCPPYVLLDRGLGFTIRAVWVYRKDEKRMREAYFLAGLMDCITNQISPILRTDILRAMYKKIFLMKEELNVRWYGPLDDILLPIEPGSYDKSEYAATLASANTLKELYQAIRRGTDEMFDVLSNEYVFFCPGGGE
ncbi:MAG: hypothetical protein V2J25_05115 [Desulfatiglans sp.]|jgi:hypothetical protein|nr:hypothetical protein [Thermodesulfobacteriota bacterium]MEE4352232.1 hypothetical protein [Desulfatiglans sp.]